MATTYLVPNTVHTKGKDITYYKIRNDVNGNPRYLFRYLSTFNYNTELVREAFKSVGGKKFRGGIGGVVLSTYDLTGALHSVFDYIEEHRND